MLLKTSSYINPVFESALPCSDIRFIKLEVSQTLGKRLNVFWTSRAATLNPHSPHPTHHPSPLYSLRKSVTDKPTVLQYYISALVSASLSTLAYFWGGLLDVLIMMLSLCNKSVSPKVLVWSSLVSGDIHIKRIQWGIVPKPSHTKLVLNYGQVWMMHSFPHSHCQAHFPPPPHKSREKLSQ